MAISDENISQIRKILTELFKHIVLGKTSPEHAPLISNLSKDDYFGIDTAGYYGPFIDLLRAIFSIESIGLKWSIQPVRQKIIKVLAQLANNKREGISTDFDQITLDLIKEIDIEFQEKEYYVSVLGLSLDKALHIGDVDFFPLTEKKELFNNAITTHLDDLITYRDCLASTVVNAEEDRSTSIVRERVEKALNILRFIGALVWWDRPVGHIYLAGKQLGRVSYTIAVEPETHHISSVIGHTESTPLPFKVDEEFMNYSDIYGFKYILSLLNQNVSPIESDFLAAIQWFGFATQELEPLVSFVKFYIAIETALKKDKEAAKKVLPQRVSILLNPWSKSQQEVIEKEFVELIDERNSVFHEGKSSKFNAEYLSTVGLDYSRQILNQLRKRIKSEKLRTKDDLIMWTRLRFAELEK